MSNVKNMRDYEEPDVVDQNDNTVDLTAYLDVLVRYRWTFLGVAATVLVLGLIYALIARPVYRADILVQVEEQNSTGGSANKLMASVAPVFDAKPAASAEVELLQSRMVVGKAVDSLQLDILATPHYFPIIGQAIAGFNHELSQPGLLGWGGFAWGSESIIVSRLEVPQVMESRKLLITALGNGKYRLAFASDDAKAEGVVGSPLTIATTSGSVTVQIEQLQGRPGASFVVVKLPRTAAIADLQPRLQIGERGKQSGVIGVALEGSSPAMTAAILNEIGAAYVDQNVRRKAEEAEKSLTFLETQLPQLKQEVETAETRYNAMRNQRGTIDLTEESRLILSQSVAIQTRLQELRQKRQEMIARFTGNHPVIEIMDAQIASLTAQLNNVTGKIQKLPEVEQNVLRLMRDVKVSTELYQSLLNDVQQLKLVRASKVGNARLVDPAEVPLSPVRPNRRLICLASLVLGVVAGLAVVILRRVMDGGVTDADEVEQHTGMTVYATIPFSVQQARLHARCKEHGQDLLARHLPDDPAVESLRSFRTALQFAMVNTNSNVVMITGPAPDVGKSFICANFATVAASAGRRVALIDADLRRGSLNHRFGTKRTPGLTEYLTGTPLEQVLQRDVVPGVDFIATGAEPPVAADLLQNPAMDTLLETLKARYDIVLLDSPPVLAASDAAILAGKAGAVFLVARADSTTAGELNAAQRTIQQAGNRIKGVLFNGLRVEGRWYRAHYRFGKYRYINQYGGEHEKRA